MGYNKQDYIRIKAEYSKKYLRAQEAAGARRMELYAAVPEVRELDAELARTGMEIMGAISAGDNILEKLALIRQKNKELLEARADLLTAHGFPADYSDMRYECEVCGDTGFVNTGMCDCMRRALIEAGYESSGLGGLIRTQTFENFSLEYYKESGNAERMRQDLERMKAFAQGFDRGTYRNYLFLGGTGLGKTHMSTAVAKTVIERGFDVAYVTAVGMIRDFNAKQFDKGVGMKNDPDRYMEVDLMIVDDLGAEITNQFTVSCLYDLINQRINNRKCTIFNTNLSFRELEARYGERIGSRLLGEYAPVMFSGTDIRRQKIQKGV